MRMERYQSVLVWRLRYWRAGSNGAGRGIAKKRGRRSCVRGYEFWQPHLSRMKMP